MSFFSYIPVWISTSLLNSCSIFFRQTFNTNIEQKRLSENMQKVIFWQSSIVTNKFSFYRARWRENRTIFNTPNPRLMNVSLLRENKLLHQERRGSRTSARGPSRQPSMASLRAHSPNSQGIEIYCSITFIFLLNWFVGVSSENFNRKKWNPASCYVLWMRKWTVYI